MITKGQRLHICSGYRRVHSEDRQYNNDEPTGSVIDNAGKLRKQESKEGIKTAGNTRQTKADHTKPKAAAVVT